MKRTKFLIITVLVSAVLASTSFAQLSDRVNSPSTFKIGTRPVAGNLGVTIATSYQDINKVLNNTNFEMLPIVSVRYYIMNDLVITGGVKWSADRTIVKGDVDPDISIGTTTFYENRDITSSFMLSPGIEKHFMSSNILDVYIGGRLPLGVVTDISQIDQEFDNGDYTYNSQSKRSFVYGLDGFVGLQAFIADLPMALGCEIGLSLFAYANAKTKNVNESSIGGTTSDQTYYTSNLDPAGYSYSKLNARESEIKTDLRVTLSYFFKN